MSKVIFLNKKKIIEKLKQLALKTKSKDKNIFKIFLFGSLVNDTYTGTSDADLIIVLKKSNLRFLDRIPDFALLFLDLPISVDIFPYTEKEVEHIPFAQKAISEGLRLC
jgi:predicted nucleotidyltransferase